VLINQAFKGSTVNAHAIFVAPVSNQFPIFTDNGVPINTTSYAIINDNVVHNIKVVITKILLPLTPIFLPNIETNTAVNNGKKIIGMNMIIIFNLYSL